MRAGVWSRRAAWPLAAAAGLAQAASLALPGRGAPLWWLQIASLALLCALLAPRVSWRRAAALGGCFATSWLVGSFWWLFISMHTYGGLAAPLALLAVLALALALACYYAVACGLFSALAPANPAWRALLFAALWLLAELARGQWWTGFPWGAGGYAQVDGPLAPLARWVGVYGVGALAALLAMGLAQLRGRHVRQPRAWLAAAGMALLLAGAAWQRERALSAGDAQALAPLPVALLQGNIPQDEKFQPGSGVPQALAWYGQRLQRETAALVVAPETALPVLPGQLPAGWLAAASARYRQGAQALLVGVPLGDGRRGYTNSAWGFAPGLDPPYRYDKAHLVPFGEFIPPLFRWFTEMLQIPLANFRRGARVQPPMAWAGQRLAPNICYEDLFGEELAAQFVDAASAPTVLVNLSNIAWFGDSIAVDQHLAISRMRALELERPMLRATNTGATAIIDHRARVQALLAPATRAVLHGEVAGRAGAVTPYAAWAGRWGLAPLWALGLAALAGALWRARRCRVRALAAGAGDAG